MKINIDLDDWVIVATAFIYVVVLLATKI